MVTGIAATAKTADAPTTARWKPVRKSPEAIRLPRTATPTTLPVCRAALMTLPAMPV